MRYILIILVFLSVGAKAQMIIKAHANYRPYAAPVGGNLLLDDYPNAAAAYSLRKLDKDYSGSAIRVRRSNDNAESDIGFTSSGDLDTASLKTFVGANSGFVTTWYDQSGNARNATQGTAANQPRIALLGNLEDWNGPVAPRWDGVDDRLEAVFNYTITSQSSFVVASPFIEIVSANFMRILSQGGNGDDFATGSYIPMLRNGTTSQIGSYVNSQRANNTIVTGTRYLFNSIYDGTQINNRINGGTAATSVVSINSNYTRLAIGGRTSTTSGSAAEMLGHMQEVIIWNTDQSSNRTGIQNNINTHYGIY